MLLRHSKLVEKGKDTEKLRRLVVTKQATTDLKILRKFLQVDQ